MDEQMFKKLEVGEVGSVLMALGPGLGNTLRLREEDVGRLAKAVDSS
jgi:hypothetical protein